MILITFHLPADVQDPLGVVRTVLRWGDRAAAHFVGAFRDDAEVHDGRILHVGLPVVQSRFEVVGETEAQPRELAFTHQRY